MSIFPTGGRFAVSGCYALLSRDGDVIDLSHGMRDLCRRFRPRKEAPTSIKALIVERDHPLLLEHLERVWAKQESGVLALQVARSFGEPLNAHLFSVPASREKAVQSFLSVDGCEAPPADEIPSPGEHRAHEDRIGFMVLRPEGDFDRLLIRFCDPQLRRSLGVEQGALVDQSIYQVFSRDACRSVLEAVRDSRSSGSARRCSFKTQAGKRLRAIIFVADSSAMMLTESDQEEVPAGGLSTASTATATELERFIDIELRPGLRALRNLARSIESSLGEGAVGSRRAKVMEQLSAQIFDAVEGIGGRSSRRRAHITEDEDVLPRLVQGVRDIAHPALAARTRSVSVVDEVAPETRILCTYSLDSLQQILVDLLGEAALVAPQPHVECRIRSKGEERGRVQLEFEVTARTEEGGEERSSALEGREEIEHLRRRPMFKACRRFLRALGAELEVEVEGRAYRYRFQLSFGKLSALEKA